MGSWSEEWHQQATLRCLGEVKAGEKLEEGLERETEPQVHKRRKAEPRMGRARVHGDAESPRSEREILPIAALFREHAGYTLRTGEAAGARKNQAETKSSRRGRGPGCNRRSRFQVPPSQRVLCIGFVTALSSACPGGPILPPARGWWPAHSPCA